MPGEVNNPTAVACVAKNNAGVCIAMGERMQLQSDRDAVYVIIT
jgi:hypothetical protein